MRSAARPLVSIGMPVFNGVAFIDRALAALAEQTYRDFRLLVSDNRSTDGTWEVLEEWASRDDRILLHRQDSNIGASRNFRYVLDWADSEYFMWFAYDDWLSPNYLEELVAIADASPGCALACPMVVHARPDGSRIREVRFPLLAESRLGRIRQLLNGMESAWIYGLFRAPDLRRALQNAEEFGYIWSWDHIAVLPVILNDSICGTNRTKYYWRRVGLSKDRHRPKTQQEKWRFALKYLQFHARLSHASDLSWGEKLLSWPWLLRHANRTLESFWQRPMKRAIRSAVRRLVKAGVSGRTSS